MSDTFKQVIEPAKPERAVELLPCKVCGSRNIKLSHLGYSSFNVGGGTCENGHVAKCDTMSCSPTPEELAQVWNEGQTPTPLERLEVRSAALEAENDRLKRRIHELRLETTSGPTNETEMPALEPTPKVVRQANQVKAEVGMKAEQDAALPAAELSAVDRAWATYEAIIAVVNADVDRYLASSVKASETTRLEEEGRFLQRLSAARRTLEQALWAARWEGTVEELASRLNMRGMIDPQVLPGMLTQALREELTELQGLSYRSTMPDSGDLLRFARYLTNGSVHDQQLRSKVHAWLRGPQRDAP